MKKQFLSDNEYFPLRKREFGKRVPSLQPQTSKTKPNIEAVFSAFQAFQNSQLRITRNEPVGLWPAKMKESQNELRKRLEAWGLAEHIDWSDSNK